MGIMMDSLMESFEADEKLAVAKALAEDVIATGAFKAFRLDDGRAVLLSKEDDGKGRCGFRVRFEIEGTDVMFLHGFSIEEARDARFDSFTRDELADYVNEMTESLIGNRKE
jgi:hypothetical protein